MRLSIALLAVAAIAAAGAVRANDSVAESAAGGLVLKQTADIDMVSEDLYVSEERIRVRYVFRNRRAEDVRVTVAFPMPERDFSELRYSDAAFPGDFETRVDGRPVAMFVERKAMLAAADHSALLAGLGVPILAENTVVAVSEAVDGLSPEQQRRLESLGLIEASEYDTGEGMRRYYEPMWTVTEIWHWDQVFPAGRDLVVEHAYTPGVGGSAGSMLADRSWRETDEGRRYLAEYCADRAFLAGVDRMVGRGTEDRPAWLGERWIRYVLTTGGNWASPIGEFRLVVDKGSPDRLVSFCGEGVRRIGPTQFEMRRRNWRPDRDLAVLIVVPYRDE